MRYIRCARHQQEQNLYAFQYMGKIYYRAFRDIPPGKEMLVWYDEKYPQYLGIPSNVFDMASFMANGKDMRSVFKLDLTVWSACECEWRK